MTHSKSLPTSLVPQSPVPGATLRGTLTLAALLLAGCAGTVFGQSIYSVGTPDGSSYSGAYGVSANGSAVAVSVDMFGEGHAYRWTLRKGPLNLGILDGAYSISANGISRDGSALVGGAYFPDDSGRAWLWTAEDGLQDLGLPEGIVAASANGVSRRGRVVVGAVYNTDFMGQAFRWTAETGIQTIGTPPGGIYSNANAISDDGSTIIGQADFSMADHAFRWTARSGMQELPLLSPADPMSNAFGVNHNGSLVAGFSGKHAVVWTKGGIRDLGIFPGDEVSIAYALNSDGSVVGGYSFRGFSVRATLWTKAGGMVDLNTYLPTRGVDLTGWELGYTRGVSEDGRTIVGEGTYLGEWRGWVVKLGPDRDCDRDGDDDDRKGRGSDRR